MKQRQNSAAYWRALAEEARVFAEAMTDARLRLYMLSAEQTYKRLAGFAEEKPRPRAAGTNALDHRAPGHSG